MNASRLRSIISFALKAEQSTKIQNHLQTLVTALANLASTPNNPEYQTITATSVTNLESILKKFEDSLTPAQKKDLVEIKAYQYFSTSLVEEIKRSITQNAMTPSVT